MPLDINGYDDTFKAFVDFAQAKTTENNKTAVARLGQEGDGALDARSVSASDTDYVHNWFRSGDDQDANDRARRAFRKSVADMFGGEARIPAAVRKAMLMGDYKKKGRPLTARRIMAVKKAIDADGTATPFNFKGKIDVAPAAAKMKAALLLAKSADADAKGRAVDALLEDVKSEPALLALLMANDCKAARKVMLGSGNELRSTVAIRAKLMALRENIMELREAAGCDNRLTKTGLKLLAKFGGNALPRGTIRKIVEAAGRIAVAPLRGLSSSLSPARLASILCLLEKGVNDVRKEAKVVEALGKDAGGEEVVAANSFILGLVLSRCDGKTLRGLKAGFYSKANAKVMDALQSITGERLPAGEDPPMGLLSAITQVSQDLGNTFRQDCVAIVNELLGVDRYELVSAAYEDVETDEDDLRAVYAAVERHTREEHRDLVEKWTAEYDHQFPSGPAPS